MSTISSSTTSTTAYKVTADTTGALVLQTGATPTTAVTIDTSQNVGIGTSSPSTKLHVVGEVTATQGLGGTPTFAYNQSAAQSVPNATSTKLTFTTSEWDTTSGMYASSRFTPTVAGYYQINAAVYISSQCTLFVIIFKNGSAFKQAQQSSTNQAAAVSSLVYCNGSTDYIEIYCYQALGSAQNTLANASQTYFNGCLVRGA